MTCIMHAENTTFFEYYLYAYFGVKLGDNLI